MWVVLLRAVNVGGHQTFRPSAVAEALAELEAASVGAAGTFVVGADVPEARVRSAFAAALPFATEAIVRPAGEVIALVERGPGAPPEDGARAHVTALAAVPAKRPTLPIERPEGPTWDVRVVDVDGTWVTSWRVKRQPRTLDANPIVEKAFGVAGTTRTWDTLVKVRARIG